MGLAAYGGRGPMMLLFWAAVIVQIVHRASGHSALDNLEERFARGEIDREEF